MSNSMYSLFIRGQLAISVKSQRVNIIACAGNMVSFTTTQSCLSRVKAARNDIKMKGHGCVTVKLYLKKTSSHLQAVAC